MFTQASVKTRASPRPNNTTGHSKVVGRSRNLKTRDRVTNEHSLPISMKHLTGDPSSQTSFIILFSFTPSMKLTFLYSRANCLGLTPLLSVGQLKPHMPKALALKTDDGRILDIGGR
jgi:hypothetical protein